MEFNILLVKKMFPSKNQNFFLLNVVKCISHFCKQFAIHQLNSLRMVLKHRKFFYFVNLQKPPKI